MEGILRTAVWTLAAGISLLAVPSAAMAEDALKLSGSVRLRYEGIDGQPRAGFDDADSLFNIRTTLLAELDLSPVTAVVEVYDSRAYGADPGTPLSTGEVNAVEPVQAYLAFDLGDAVAKGTKLKLLAGRSMLNLGSRRLIAADDYRNTTNSYTGLRADLSVGKQWHATAIYMLPQQRLPSDAASLRDNSVRLDRESFDAVLWGGQFRRERVLGASAVEFAYYHFGEADSPRLATANRSLDTVGIRFVREPSDDGLDHDFEWMEQRGTTRISTAANAAPVDVKARFVHAEVGYSWSTGWRPHVSLELDYAGGDRPGGSYGRFDTLFGMRRADLGPAGLYNAIGRANLLSSGLRLEVTPTKRLDAFISTRTIWLAERTDSFSTTGVRDRTGQSGRYAGTQFDGRVRYWLIAKKLRAEGNFVYLAKGRFLREAPNAPRNGDTRYFSLNLSAFF
jgi:hypothetical protein